MQKKIIALAIAGLVSGGAFAQSTVTISGYVDGGYYGQSLQTAGLGDTKTGFAGNGSGTSQLNITVTEDLGNGLSAGYFAETDLAIANNAGAALGNSANFLHLTSTKWGSIKGGTLNTAALVAEITAQPFGTAIGSGISGAFGRLSRGGSNGGYAAGATGGTSAEGEYGAGLSGARSVRVNNSLSYTTPVMSGFAASLQWAKKNDESAPITVNTAGFVALGLQYNNGPINVHYVNEQISNSSGTVASANGAGLTLGEKVTHNLLSGNYNFGPATIYGGWTSSKSSGSATLADSRSWNIGLKYQVTGPLWLAGNFLRVDDKTITDMDRNLNALGFEYMLSKRTNFYGRYESGDNNKNGTTGNGVGGFTRYQLGMKHAF